MTQYRKKPIVINAMQWWHDGDHPAVTVLSAAHAYESTGPLDFTCRICATRDSHGWIATLEGGHIVCPGDWIITGVQGEQYPCKPDIFTATYERVS